MRRSAQLLVLLAAGCSADTERGSGYAANPNAPTPPPELPVCEPGLARLLAYSRGVVEPPPMDEACPPPVDETPLQPPADAGGPVDEGSQGIGSPGHGAAFDAGTGSPHDATAVSDAGAPASDAAPSEPAPLDPVAAAALPIYGVETGVRLSQVELWERLAASRAVCLGEVHNLPAHHYAELQALGAMQARASEQGRTLAVGFEMFQRPFQAALDGYVAGTLSEAELIAQTEYERRWGYDFAFYRPLLELARGEQLPALALNARSELTRLIARGGLESLGPAEQAELPELDLADEEHRQYIFGLLGVFDHDAAAGLENIYVAQTVWDETMADTAARWLGATGTSAQVLVFSGAVHCHRSAIPRRITRRTAEPALATQIVFESELESGRVTADGYDLLVVLDD